MKSKLLSAAFAAMLLAFPMAASAQVSVGITIAPPAPRYEAVPPPRAGWVWAPGGWRWINGHYVWHRGYWVVARAGWRWVPGHWVARGPNWYRVPGHWVRV
jgi:WXXGXW repeat (2 copies)